MAPRDSVITDFTKGEISKKFEGRFDLELYNQGVRKLENWIPFTQGGVHSRPGSKYLAITKSSAKARLIPFVVNETYPFVLEFTNNLIRIWLNGVLVEASAGVPREVATTYTLAQLPAIQIQKLNNVLYIVHPSHAIATLTWGGSGAATVFTLANLTINFADDVSAWVAGTAYVVGDIRYNGTPTKIYECITAGTSAGSGGPTTEADDITDGTVHWYWQATKPFSQASDYPAAIAHFQGRMYYAGTGNDPQRVFGSEPFFYGDFNYFSMISFTSTQIDDASGWLYPEVPETSEVTKTVQVFGEGEAFYFEIASKEDDDIYWLLSADALIIGTFSAEWILPPDTTALNIQPKRRSGIGSANLQAEMFQEAPVFAQGTLSKALLREYAYLAQNAELQSVDLTFGADHMLENGITQMAVMKNPQPTLFAVTNGELACLLYNKAYGVIAWYHITTAGTTSDIESVCVVPGTTDDEVYISVNRAGGRVVEKLDKMWDATVVPLDSYVNVASVAGATQTGLDRFDGETVTIFNVTDSTVHTAAVAAGSLTYPTGDGTGDHVVIGKAFTCSGQTMRLNPGQGRIRKTSTVTVRVYDSFKFKVGYVEAGPLDEARKGTGAPWTTAYTGDVPVPFQGEWDRDSWLWFIQDAPYRTTILALMAGVDV